MVFFDVLAFQSGWQTGQEPGKAAVETQIGITARHLHHQGADGPQAG